MRPDKQGKALVRRIKQRGIDDAFPEFEDFDQAKDSRKRLIRHLKKQTDSASSKLAKKLRGCRQGDRCMSGACSVCYRRFRKRIICETLGLLTDLTTLKLVTIILYSDAIPNGCIRKFAPTDLERIKGRLKKQLNRLKVAPALIGSFEMVYRAEEDDWLPHFHCVMETKQKHELKNLRKYLLNTSKGRASSYRPESSSKRKKRPLEVKNISTNYVSVIGYLFKPYWARKMSWSKFPSKKLEGSQLTSAALVLDQLPLRKKLLLYKVKSYSTAKGIQLTHNVPTR